MSIDTLKFLSRFSVAVTTVLLLWSIIQRTLKTSIYCIYLLSNKAECNEIKNSMDSYRSCVIFIALWSTMKELWRIWVCFGIIIEMNWIRSCIEFWSCLDYKNIFYKLIISIFKVKFKKQIFCFIFFKKI